MNVWSTVRMYGDPRFCNSLNDHMMKNTNNCEKLRQFVFDTTEKCPLKKINFDIFLMMRAEGKFQIKIFFFDIEKN